MIKDLLQYNGRVYVHFSSTAECKQFLCEAEKEGFRFGDGKKPTEKDTDSIFAINKNMTLNYVGFLGHMAYASKEEMTVGSQKLIKIEYNGGNYKRVY